MLVRLTFFSYLPLPSYFLGADQHQVGLPRMHSSGDDLEKQTLLDERGSDRVDVRVFATTIT